MGKNKRKKIRLTGYDYSKPGYYFVTFCTKDMKHLFGEIIAPAAPVGATAPGRQYMNLTPLGKCVDETIQVANKGNVIIDKYIIMPNHVHAIIILAAGDSGDQGRSPLQNVVRNIKSYVRKQAGYDIWHPRFHDHIIRNKDKYALIWNYIDNNPALWEKDKYYSVH